jgi:hypothetical protein
MVFNWVYRIFRTSQEEQMHHKAEELVKEVQRNAVT